MDVKQMQDIISHVFGYQAKEKQLEAMQSYYLNGTDTVFVAPTGFGKSLLYQAAPFLFDTDRYEIFSKYAAAASDSFAQSSVTDDNS